LTVGDVRKTDTNKAKTRHMRSRYIIMFKSNQIIYLDKQIQKNVDKMSNEKA